MPKKQPRNAFYFFMIAFREEEKKKGILYQNLREVQVAADPAWRQIHPAQRAKYESMAKREKEKLRGNPEQKFTSNGISYAQIEENQRMMQEMVEQELAYIKNFVSQKKIDNMLLQEDIFVIDVNAYCHCGTHYFMAESAVLRFNILDGVRDLYFENIQPGRIPPGFRSAVISGAKELRIDSIPEGDEGTDFMKILATLMDYLKVQSKGRSIQPLYTLPEKVEMVQDFIRQLCLRAGEDDSHIRVYRLDTLFYYMVNAMSKTLEDSFPQPTLATNRLKNDLFSQLPGLACSIHEAKDKASVCSRSRVMRWAYTVLDKCCLLAGVQPEQGRHLPRELDIMGVLSCLEEKKKKAAARSERSVEDLPASFNRNMRISTNKRAGTSTVASSECSTNCDSAAGWIDIAKKRETGRNQLRLPKDDYWKTFAEAPDLSVDESNFPKLGGAGRGRGFVQKK